MKKRKNLPSHRQAKLSLVFVLVLVLGILLLIFKVTNFNRQIPDVVEIPKDVQESIKDVKSQKTLRVPILVYHWLGGNQGAYYES